MVVLVCGGRNYSDCRKVFDTLDKIHAAHGVTLISGCARGADTLGLEWAKSRGVAHTCHVADWRTHGPSAGPRRNQMLLQDLLSSSGSKLVVAFPGGVGTADMVSRALKAGVRVVRIA